MRRRDGERAGPDAAEPRPAQARSAPGRRPAAAMRPPLALLLLLRLAPPVAAAAAEAPVSARRSLVWGPGLRAAVVLPVRYFYLQAVSAQGQNLTRSPPGSVGPRAPSPAAREAACGPRSSCGARCREAVTAKACWNRAWWRCTLVVSALGRVRPQPGLRERVRRPAWTVSKQ